MSWVAAGGGTVVSIPDGRPAVAGASRVIRVGDAAQPVPAPLLPREGWAVPALTQDSPSDIVDGWVRLWAAGFLADHPGWDGVICALQDDLSHWLHVSADEVVSTRSFITPRLVRMLHGSAQAAPDALADTMSRPERLAAVLRVAEISGSAAHVTGHLIGAELAAARPYWLGQQIAVIGERPLSTSYAEALAAQGSAVTQAAIGDMLPRGLAALAAALGLDN